MTLEQIQEHADALFQELEKKKIQDEKGDLDYNGEYRIYANNKICAFFKKVAETSDLLDYYSVPSEYDGFIRGILMFKSKSSPIDIDLVCSKRYINVPIWFKKVCIMYLDISFSKMINPSDVFCSKIKWFIDAIDNFQNTIQGYQSQGETYLDTIDRLGTNSSKYKLFGQEKMDQKEFNMLELGGLLFWLKDDLDIHGWDFDCSIGKSLSGGEKDYLFFRLDFTRFELYEAYLEARKEHKPSMAYPLIQKGVHKAYRNYIEGLLKDLKVIG